MNFDFSEEQDLLRDQARGFLTDKCPNSVSRAILEGDPGAADELWKEMAALGWTGTAIPEEYGGVGMSAVDLCVIAEELGRALAPTPFSSSVYLATEALLMAGSEEQKTRLLPSMADGSRVGTFAVSEGPGNVTAKNLVATVINGKLSGTKYPVPDGCRADFTLVLAKGGGEASLYLVDLTAPGVARETITSLDPTREQAKITFTDVDAELIGKKGEGFSLVSAIFDRAAVLFAFEQVGGALVALDEACEYARNRFAFGRSIASYQAIKHKLADMYVAATLARSNCYYGAWALGANAPELALAAATARVCAIDAFDLCSKENIQTHGGMGFTWEFDCQLYYRRARALAVNLGNKLQWEDKLIRALEARGEMVA